MRVGHPVITTDPLGLLKIAVFNGHFDELYLVASRLTEDDYITTLKGRVDGYNLLLATCFDRWNVGTTAYHILRYGRQLRPKISGKTSLFAEKLRQERLLWDQGADVETSEIAGGGGTDLGNHESPSGSLQQVMNAAEYMCLHRIRVID